MAVIPIILLVFACMIFVCSKRILARIRLLQAECVPLRRDVHDEDVDLQMAAGLHAMGILLVRIITFVQ